MTGSSQEDFEVPKEFIPTQNEIELQTEPAWLHSVELNVPLDVFPESEFRVDLQNLITALQPKNGTRIPVEKEIEIINHIIQCLPNGNYEREEQFSWLICFACRIFLQKNKTNLGAYHFRLLDCLKQYNTPGLYCPLKMHVITKEIYSIVHGNPHSISHVVRKIHHINPVCHYISISLVCALIKQTHEKTNPEIFNVLSPTEIDTIVKAFELSLDTTNINQLHAFLILLIMYNNLVVFNNNIPEIHSSDLAEYLVASKKYFKHVRQWGIRASKFVDRVMFKTGQQNGSLIYLKELIQFDLLKQIESHKFNKKETEVIDYDEYICN